MAYKVKSFRAWVSYYDVAQELSEKDQGAFYRAIFEFMFMDNDVESQLPKMARICFKLIKPNLKRSKSKAKKDDETCADDAEDALSTSHENGTKTSLISKELEVNNRKEKEVSANDGKNIPPSLDEVRAWVAAKGYTFDPEAFHAFYESKGWKVGKEPMKNWHSACTTWQKNRDEEKGGEKSDLRKRYANAF